MKTDRATGAACIAANGIKRNFREDISTTGGKNLD